MIKLVMFLFSQDETNKTFSKKTEKYIQEFSNLGSFCLEVFINYIREIIIIILWIFLVCYLIYLKPLTISNIK